MSHEIMNSDGLVLVGIPAWHGLGTVVKDAPTAREALKIAKLDWRLDLAPVYCETQELYSLSDGGLEHRPVRHEIKTSRACVRSDTGAVLGLVSDRYHALQNETLADLTTRLAAEGVIPKIETAGSLRGGRDVFFLVPLGEYEAAPGDTVKEYLLFASSHDGTGALRIIATGVRVVCKNTHTEALAGAEGTGISVAHDGLMEAKLDEIVLMVQAARKRGEAFKLTIQEMANYTLSRDAMLDYLRKVFAAAFPDKEKRVGNATRFLGMQAESEREELVSTWYTLAGNATGNNPGGSNLWTAYNGITEWADHRRTVRVTAGANGDRQGSRVYSNLFGTGSVIKAHAMKQAELVLA